jgi:hypothetical protein
MLVHKIAFSPKVVNDTALAEEYFGLDMEPNTYLLNLYRASVHKKRKELKDFREPVDKSRYMPGSSDTARSYFWSPCVLIGVVNRIYQGVSSQVACRCSF